MKRFGAQILLLLGFWLAFGQALGFGWLGLDDDMLLRVNPHLGHLDMRSIIWALTDVSFGRRWTPVLWLVALLPPGSTAFGFHLLVLLEGSVFCLLTFTLFKRWTSDWLAFAATFWFVVSPLRCEIFDWTMGFVYLTVALCVVLSYLAKTRFGAGWWLFIGLLTYPQAAGFLLIRVFQWRKSVWGAMLLGGLTTLAILQFYVRVVHGFAPIHANPILWSMALPHFALMSVVPFATSPIFPPGFYPWLGVGVIILGLSIWFDWKMSLGALVVLFPTILATVTEPFSLGARYTFLLHGFLAGYLCKAAGRHYLPQRARVLIAVMCGIALLSASDGSMYSGRFIGVLDHTIAQCVAVGVPPWAVAVLENLR